MSTSNFFILIISLYVTSTTTQKTYLELSNTYIFLCRMFHSNSLQLSKYSLQLTTFMCLILLTSKYHQWDCTLPINLLPLSLGYLTVTLLSAMLGLLSQRPSFLKMFFRFQHLKLEERVKLLSGLKEAFLFAHRGDENKKKHPPGRHVRGTMVRCH